MTLRPAVRGRLRMVGAREAVQAGQLPRHGITGVAMQLASWSSWREVQRRRVVRLDVRLRPVQFQLTEANWSTSPSPSVV